MAEAVRLQKYLSQAGVASRRRAEELIVSGRIRVNGSVVTELGARVDPTRDSVELDGRRVAVAATVWLAVHKPRGHVTTRHDPQGRPTLYDLIPEQYRGLFYVGRLDYDSEGLVLLTNEGEAANRLLHPRYGTEREYEAEIRGDVTPAELRRLRSGIELEDGPARAEDARRVRGGSAGQTIVRVVLKEGRKREVRRMFASLGHRVERLVRVRYGPVKLGSLPPGGWRRLTANEMLALSAVGREGAA